MSCFCPSLYFAQVIDCWSGLFSASEMMRLQSISGAEYNSSIVAVALLNVERFRAFRKEGHHG